MRDFDFSLDTADMESFGPYMIAELLHADEEVVVHRAIEKRPGRSSRTVALKRLRPNLALHAASTERFLQEACLAELLNHPNVACVLDQGCIGGTPFMAMEFISGQRVQQAIDQAAEAPPPAEQVIAFLQVLCSVLQDLHSISIPNDLAEARDRKLDPSLLIVTKDGELHISDPSIVLPHRNYLAAKDLSSVGAIAYELLCGRPAPSAAQMAARPRLSTLNPGCPLLLDSLVMRILRGEMASAREVLAELEGLARSLHHWDSAAVEQPMHLDASQELPLYFPDTSTPEPITLGATASARLVAKHLRLPLRAAPPVNTQAVPETPDDMPIVINFLSEGAQPAPPPQRPRRHALGTTSPDARPRARTQEAQRVVMGSAHFYPEPEAPISIQPGSQEKFSWQGIALGFGLGVGVIGLFYLLASLL
jgi:serine/threonine protein kinase